jgi:putative alpha-1,2-mannosidase
LTCLGSKPGDESFMGEAPDTSKENKYVRSVTLSGEALDRVWLQREDLSRDGHLVLGMGDGLSE